MFCDAQRRCQRRYCYGYLKVKDILSSKRTRSDGLHKDLKILPIGISACLPRLCSGVGISPCCMVCDILLLDEQASRQPTPKSKACNDAARWLERTIVSSIDIYETPRCRMVP